jgi:hypothetical protein
MKKDWTAIPMLPCVSIEETLSFWEPLGFRITYKQTRPYQYGAIERRGCQLHFGRVKGMEAASNLYSGCLFIVPDVENLYRELAEKLRQQLGRAPYAGIPRISRMKPGATRFTLTDVSGNSIIFINQGEADQETYDKVNDKNQSPLQKAIANAIRFRDYKEDEKAAAAVLDAALRKAKDENAMIMAEALIMRIDLAVFMNDTVRADECKALLKQLDLPEDQTQKHN